MITTTVDSILRSSGRIAARVIPKRRHKAIPQGQQLTSLVFAHRRGICDAMERYGGGFARHISQALRCADPLNTRRLCEALPDLIAPYCPGGKFFQS